LPASLTTPQEKAARVESLAEQIAAAGGVISRQGGNRDK
jgi:hypothetical protein